MSFVHDDADFDALLQIVAGKRAIGVALVEKDYWVTHTLWALHAQGFEVWFKGGTSLSKGFGLIERFSPKTSTSSSSPGLSRLCDR
jgi:predicted nucleotidyltransferase component of viral defense system